MKEVVLTYKAEITEIRKFPLGEEFNETKESLKEKLQYAIKRELDVDDVRVYGVKISES